MNSRLGIFFSTVLMLVGIALWSVTILAEEVVVTDTAVRNEARLHADAAHREAAREAVERLGAASRKDLEIEFIGRTSKPVTGD